MKKKKRTTPQAGSLARIHREMVERLSARVEPVRPPRPLWFLWGLWLAAGLAVMGFTLWMIKIQEGFPSGGPPILFLLLAFTGSALAAWEAIASSLPGRRTSRAYRLFSLLVLAGLLLMPFIFFMPAGEVMHPWEDFTSGLGCFTGVSLVGLLPWLLIGWLVSRNAAFQPGRTGAWCGVSAFLLGTTTIQLHCPNWHAGHMIMVHLLPAALLSLLAAWVGSYWFSLWKK
jgi:Negative regulator of sigma F